MLDKTFRPAEVEAKHYRHWEATNAFAADPSREAAPYTIMMPPPNITGSLHMGHALTFTLQDILIRHHRMQGRDVLWQPGTDHAGIATQLVVERQLAVHGLNHHDLGRDTFVNKMWEWKVHSGGTIMTQLRRLGSSPDWARERFTMDAGLSNAVRKMFVDLYKQGLIYRDKRLVNWDPQLRTAVSDLEVKQRTILGTLWHFRYPLEGAQGQFLTVATTRPETLLGDAAVAVHPDDERYRSLIGQRCLLPLVGRLIPIIADPYVNPDKGSGAVKITPAHDFNDFEVARRHGLPMMSVLDCDARLNENTPVAYRGLDRAVARERVVEKIKELGLLEKVEANPMALPYGDRSGAVIEPLLTDQWFVDVRMLAEPALRAVQEGRTCFVPRLWEKTYYDWMRNIQPWCVSRQIWWGHQIPAWYGPDGLVFVETTEQEAVAAATVHYGKPVKLTRDRDVLDTWFSSALWPFSTLGWPERTQELARYYPTDVLVTGFDIIFFWVARMMMMGIHVMGDVPFRTVYIHALVRDEKGQKMSKSKGNIIDPLHLIDKYGCDALRFTLAASAVPGRDVRMSEQRVQGYRNFATKLWNATRFCLLKQCYAVPGFDPKVVNDTLNRWIVGAVNETGCRVTEALATYRFNDAAQAIYAFTWNTFCDWYLEFAKLLLQGSETQTETRATAAWVLEQILILLHPFMPFITEELWEKRNKKEEPMTQLIATQWPAFTNSHDADAAIEMDFVIEVIAQVRSIRSEMNVPPAAHVPILVTGGSAKTIAQLKRHIQQIITLTRAERVNVIDSIKREDSTGTVQVAVRDMILMLQLSEAIDLVQERRRLVKAIQKLGTEIGRIDQKLNDAAFVAKAPTRVVEDNRVRRTHMVATRHKLDKALQRLATVAH
ncbi:Valyl-tRNA synthetase [invertebrate metagenome]|uniref:valine--tRNA ligase n=1 Tax=invertebrate metagenome TaxID=1711999 RepID=A0A484H8I5_9ZZZZ